MSDTTKSDITKGALIQALIASLGVITTACNEVGIARSTFYEWYDSDEDFKKAVDDLRNISLDFATSKLFELIKDKNPQAVMFYLRTVGRHRGFGEHQEIEHTGKDGGAIATTINIIGVQPNDK